MCVDGVFNVARSKRLVKHVVFTTINYLKMLDFIIKFCHILKKMASTSKNRRWTKGGEADLAAWKRLVIGAMDPDEKPEMLCTNREPVLVPFSLDQFRRALKRNLFEIENEEGSKRHNPIFTCFM